MDRVSLKSMTFFGRHGFSPAEREVGHRFEVDIDAYIKLTGELDDIDRTVDYRLLYDVARETLEDKSFRLIESIAEDLAAGVLTNQLVERVTVRVKKIHPPIAGTVGAAEVEVSRGR